MMRWKSIKKLSWNLNKRSLVFHIFVNLSKIKQLEQAAKAKEEEKWAAKQATQEAESKANNLEYEKRNIMLDSKKVSTKTAQLAEQVSFLF